MAYIKAGKSIGCKYLTDADLGRASSSSQTHIGLLEGVFDETYHASVKENVPIFLCWTVGSGTMCLEYIANPNGTLRSPKIRIGSSETEKHANIARSMRSLSELLPNRKWFMFFSENMDSKPFFAFIVEKSPAWAKAVSLGIDFDELDKKVISEESPFFLSVSSLITSLFEGDIHDPLPSNTRAFVIPELCGKGLNRIVFGAPGTGKSYRLHLDSKAFVDNLKALKEEDIIREEISLSGNSISKNFAIGLKYHEFFKGKKPKSISEQFSCSKDGAAYCIAQGAKVYNLLDSLPEYDESQSLEGFVKDSCVKLWNNTNNMQQACAGLVGYKYADYLEGKSGDDFDDILERPHTSSLGYWVLWGVQAASYEFEAKKEELIKRFERVTFHPDYSYAQFVGTYKPVKSQRNEDFISYEYVPGPFIRVLVNAIKNPKKQFLLLIEEINRSNVAAVFGDVFQLLDRDDEGSSLYPIEASEDLAKYLESVGVDATTISIPSNMYIWATMNSADQGVFPMDTAFKRRWEFEYIGINDNEADMKNSTVVLGLGKLKHKIRWNDLRHAINDYLAELGINEDKQLGPYFIGHKIVVPENSSEIDSKVFNEVFKNKVLMYLFDDAAKQRRPTVFAGVEGSKNRYSTICKEFDSKGMFIFNDKISLNVEKETENDSSENETVE